MRGPGCVDMKAGIVLGLHALAQLGVPGGVTLLVTGDEEIGSPSSRALIEAEAAGCSAALVLESAANDGALKTERKGVSLYQVRAVGRAAHAGLEPERGVNATDRARPPGARRREVRRPGARDVRDPDGAVLGNHVQHGACASARSRSTCGCGTAPSRPGWTPRCGRCCRSCRMRCSQVSGGPNRAAAVGRGVGGAVRAGRAARRAARAGAPHRGGGGRRVGRELHRRDRHADPRRARRRRRRRARGRRARPGRGAARTRPRSSRP